MTDFKSISISETPDTKPSSETQQEMMSYTPSQRNIALYERHVADCMQQIRSMQEERKEKDEEIRELRNQISTDSSYRSKFSCVKKGKIETVIQLIVVTLFTSIGALLMGVFPRSPDKIPTLFTIGATLVFAGIILGLIVRPISLVVCYVKPNLCKDT